MTTTKANTRKVDKQDDKKIVPLGNGVKQNPAVELKILPATVIKATMDNIYKRNKEDFDLYFELGRALNTKVDVIDKSDDKH